MDYRLNGSVTDNIVKFVSSFYFIYGYWYPFPAFDAKITNKKDRRVVVLANLKPRNMRGIKSSGMLMAASDSLHENVELLLPPEDSIPGERIWFGSEDDKEKQPDAATANQV